MISLAAAFVALPCAVACSASPIDEYQFTHQNTGGPQPPTILSANLTGSNFAYVNANPSSPPLSNPPIVISGGILPDDPPNFLVQADWYPTFFGYNENYYTFSVTPNPGFVINVSSFSFSANSRQRVPFLTQVQYSTSPAFANPVNFDSAPFAIPTAEVWNTFTATDNPIAQGTGTYYFRIYSQLDVNGNGTISDLLNMGNFALNGAVVPAASPTNLFWDPGKIGSPGSGGAGTWLGGATWGDGSLDFPWSNTTAEIANFSGVGGNISLGGNVIATSGINFTAPGYVIGGAPGQSLLVGGTITTSADATISANISASGGTLIKNGPAALTLAGGATFTPGTALSIAAGSLVITTGASVVANGTPQIIAAQSGQTAALILNGTGSFSSDNSLILADQGGSGILNVQDSSKLTVAALIIGNGNAGTGGAGTVNQTGGTVVATTVNLGASNSASSGTYNLIAGTLSAASIIRGNTGASATFNFNGGTLQLTADNPALLATINHVQVQNGGAIIDTNGHAVTLAQPLTPAPNSTGGLTKIGTGALTLDAALTLTGATTIGAGTLAVSTFALSNAPVIINAGATLQYDFATRIFQTGTLSGSGVLRKIGAGDLVFGGPAAANINFSPGALIDIQAGTLYGTSSFQGNWANNRASINIAAGAIFDAVEGGPTGTLQFDALTGAGHFQGGYFGAFNAMTVATIGIAGASGTFSGSISDATGQLSIIKTGAGTQVFSGANSYTGGTTIAAGTLAIGATSALPANSRVVIGNGAKLLLGNSIGALTLPSLTINAGGTLDINNDTTILPYIGASPVSAIRALIVSGFNGGVWNGPGVDSSAAHTNPLSDTAVGYIDSGNSITLKYTYYGDSNLDGKVDATDFQIFLDGLATTSANSWAQGDYTYDGRVDLGNDFNLFLTAYIEQGGSLGELASPIIDSSLTATQKSQLLAVVPEPACLGITTSAAIVALLGRKRRRRD